MIELSNVRIELNYAGVGQLLKSGEVESFIKNIADSKASALGAGYASDSYKAGTRVVASVYTDSIEAAKDNLKNNTLLKAVSG